MGDDDDKWADAAYENWLEEKLKRPRGRPRTGRGDMITMLVESEIKGGAKPAGHNCKGIQGEQALRAAPN